MIKSHSIKIEKSEEWFTLRMTGIVGRRYVGTTRFSWQFHDNILFNKVDQYQSSKNFLNFRIWLKLDIASLDWNNGSLIFLQLAFMAALDFMRTFIWVG